MAKRHGRRRATSYDPPHVRQGNTNARSSDGAKPFFRRLNIPWLLLACGVPVALCLARLDDDLWYDEIYTLSFADQPLTSIATDYSAPNNHLLFTMFLRPFFLVSSQDVALRLPSLLCSLASLACVFYLGRASGGVALGSTAVVALGLNQMFLSHTMQVRGYSLSMALTAALGLLVVQGGARSWGRATAIVLLTAALLYTIPTNAIIALGLAVAAVGARWYRSRSRNAVLIEMATWTTAAMIAALLYWPIHDQLLATRRDAATGNWANTFRLATHFYWDAWHDFVFLLPVAVLGLAMSIHHRRSRRPNVTEDDDALRGTTSSGVLSWVVAVMLVVPFVFTALLALSPFVRIYSPLLPFATIAMAWLIVEGTRAMFTWWARRRDRPEPRTSMVSVVSMMLIAAATIPWLLTYSVRLTKFREQHFAQDGYYNYYSANYHPSHVAAYLQRTIPRDQPYLVCFDDADMLNLRWYLTQSGVEHGRLMKAPNGETLARVFLVLPPLPHYDRVATQTGLTVETLESLPATANFGYYRVFVSRGLLSPRWSTAVHSRDE